MREMKSSGLPWIGDIPRSWSVTKFKHIFSATSERNPGNAQVLSLYREHGIVPKDSRDGNHNVTSLDTSNYRYVQRGDFVVNKMKAWQGSTAVSDYEGIVSPAYYVFRFREENVSKRFYHYLLRSKAYAQQFAILSGGIRVGQWDLPFESLYNIGIIMPPIDEQSRIAAFLNSHIAKIDDSIARYKALSDKLDEYRKAVITKAVTKGVQVKRVMKNSIIPWESEIPDEWREVRTKFVCIHHKDIAGEDSANYERLALTLNGVIKRDKTDTDGLQPKEFNGYQILNQGELVFKLIDLENISTSRVGYSPYTGIVSPAYIILTPKSIYPRFAEFYYLSMWRRAIFNQLGDSGVRSSLSASDLKEIPIPVPSMEEQKEIVSYLDKKCAGINEAKEKIESFVKKLEEYKKSLIYNAVTGKIEC